MGQTLGLLGFGHIGRRSRKRARAFGMPVLVWSRRFSDDAAARDAARAGVRHRDRRLAAEELMAQSDIVSVHLALTKDTRGFRERARC